MVERVERAGGDDARLAHRAADHLLPAPGLLDELRGAGEAGAERGAEALREVDPGGVEQRRPVARGDAAGDDRVHEAGAVEVRAQAELGRDAEHRLEPLEPPHAAAHEVRRLLDVDEPRHRLVAVARPGAARRRTWSAVNVPSSLSSGLTIAPVRAAGLPDSAMIGCAERCRIDLVAARPDVQPQADVVAHRPRRQEHRGLVAEEGRDALAQLGDRRVQEVLLVAHLGGGHDAPHLLGRTCLCVGAEVDDGHVRDTRRAMPEGILVAVTDHAAERYRQRVGTRTGSVDVKPEIITRVSRAYAAGRTRIERGSLLVQDERLPGVIYVCRHDLGAAAIVYLVCLRVIAYVREPTVASSQRSSSPS